MTDESATVRLDAVAAPEFAGVRLDRAVAAMFATAGAAVSRSEVAGWIKAGAVRVDGAAQKPSALLAGGERISVRAERPGREDWAGAEAVDFDVVYQDAHVLVVDKPAGLVVHPGAGNPCGTLANGLLARWPVLATVPRAGLVHRLDKDTSGLMAVAATKASQLRLVAAIAARTVQRRYLAVAEGRLIADARVDLPIGRDPRNRMRQTVRADGRRAVTHVRVRQRFAAHTLVEARLETGRTHQVRVHMGAIDHPLVGDPRYGARRVVPPTATAEQADVVRSFPRQALHAWKLAFAHPGTGQPLAFEAPLPADMRGLLLACAANDASQRSP